MGDNTTLILVLVILGAHFLFGVGFLLYKLGGKNPEKRKKEE